MELVIVGASAKSKWAEREAQRQARLERFAVALDRLFSALDRCLCPHRKRGWRADPVAVAHRLLNTLPVIRRVTAIGWSEETRAAHADAIREHSERMRRNAA